MSEEVRIGGVYRHFKGDEKLYRVLRLAYDCENLRRVVVYEQLYSAEEYPRGTIWVRPLEDFLEDKVFEDGHRVKRFEYVGD